MPRFRARSPVQRATVALIAGLTAAAAGGYAAIQAMNEMAFEQRALRLDAQVVGLKAQRMHQSSGQAYAPIFRITLPNAAPRDVASRVGSRPAAWSVGDRTTVLFDPGEPDRVVAATVGQRWGLPLAFGGAGLFFALVGVVALLA